MFDVKYLLQNEGITQGIKEGFLLFLLSGDRPIHEVLSPNLQDQHSALENQFAGMTDESFTYQDYETTRSELIKHINQSLTTEDKEFLLSFNKVTPDWTVYNFKDFPAIIWKLQNLQKLKDANPEKHQEQYEALRKQLYPQ